MVFPVVLRGRPGPRLATTPTKTTTSKPVVPWGLLLLKCSCQTDSHGSARRMASPRLADPAGRAGPRRPAARPPRAAAIALAALRRAAARARHGAREVQG